MDVKHICCLCITPCSDYKFIQNDKGESTEFYDVTVKYFDPMILTEDQDDISMHISPRVLCSGCWSHIYDFHVFQQSVLSARTLLHKTEEQDLDMYLMQEMTVMPSDNKPLLSDDSMADGRSVDFSSDLNDDVPLKTLFRLTRKKPKAKTTLCTAKSKSDTDAMVPKDNTFIDKLGKDSTTTTHPTLFSLNVNFDKELTTNQNTLVTAEMSITVKIEKEPAADHEQYSSNTETQQLSSKVPQKDGLSKNYKSRDKNMQARRKDKDQNNSLNVNKNIPSSNNKRSKHLRPVRKNKTTKIQNKETKSSSGKLKEKRREDDIFIAKFKPILDCDLCSATVSNFDEMRDHFRADHNTRYYIKCCGRKFYRRYALIAHIRLHVNPESYKCDICGKLSTTKHNLQLHKKVVHSESKQFECEICHKLFNQKPNLDRHLLIHVEGEKNFFCKECGRGYVLEVQLKSHMKSVHEDNHICDQCGKICHGQGALKSHLMEHAGVRRRKFPCDICGVEIVSKIGLKRHKAAFHHDGSTAYVCGICGKVTSSENALLHHKKYVHEKNKKYKCTFCDKAFMQPKGLREHIASHTGVDLYQCPHCPQTFKVSANMHHHRKRAHPIEWEEARRNKVTLPKVNIDLCTNQVVL